MRYGKADYRPSLCVLELTNRCNLRCPHCASDSGTRRCYEMSRTVKDKKFQADFKAAASQQ